MRGSIFLFLLVWCGFSFNAVNAAEEAPKPNIVLIFIDDMGYGDIGPFGNTRVKTPHLDQFAQEGMKFTSFYATPVCSMSRACLLTGCYNARVSIPGVLFPPSRIGLHPNEITLAEIMQPHGYSYFSIISHRVSWVTHSQTQSMILDRHIIKLSCVPLASPV